MTNRTIEKNIVDYQMNIGNFAGNAANVAPEKPNNNTNFINIDKMVHA